MVTLASAGTVLSHRRYLPIREAIHASDPFDYSYTGLGLYWINGQIVVGDVMKGSPADKAGFKVDDVIVALNNNFSLNLQTYKNMLQNIGERIKVIVKRPDGLSVLSLKIRSIF